MSPLFAARALSDRLFIPRGRGWGIPQQSRSRRSFRQAQFLLCHSVLFQGSAIGGIDRALGGEKAGGRAAGDPLRADKFGNNGIAAAGSAAPPLIWVSQAGATATGQRKSGDHVTSATMIMKAGRPSLPHRPRIAARARPLIPPRHVGRRPRMATARTEVASAAESAVRRNAEFLTQCPGPSAPPILPIEMQILRLLKTGGNLVHN